jgi:hypothetical protein
MTCSCEHDDKTSGSIKVENFLHQLREYRLLKRDSVIYGVIINFIIIIILDI